MKPSLQQNLQTALGGFTNKFVRATSVCIAIFVLNGCGTPSAQDSTTSVVASATPVADGNEPAVRAIFNQQNFTWLDSFNPEPFLIHSTEYNCPGDVLKIYTAEGGDYSQSGLQIPFPTANVVDDFTPTTKPYFLKNVSVDITNTYYLESQLNLVPSDKCSRRGDGISSLPNSCADFDRQPVPYNLYTAYPIPSGQFACPYGQIYTDNYGCIPQSTCAAGFGMYNGGCVAQSAIHAASFTQVAGATPTPAPAPTISATPTVSPSPFSIPYFGTGYYRVRDDFCAYQGPVVNQDLEATKSYVGGVNIDIDRTQLGPNEDLLMNITYHSFNNCPIDTNVGDALYGLPNCPMEWPIPPLPGYDFVHPGPVDYPYGSMGPSDHTILNIAMIGTAENFNTLIGVKQPRAWYYYDSPSYPVYAKDIATLDDPYGGIRTEQIYLPISQNALIDRIRIERVRGTYILYEVDLYRMGNRSP